MEKIRSRQLERKTDTKRERYKRQTDRQKGQPMKIQFLNIRRLEKYKCKPRNI